MLFKLRYAGQGRHDGDCLYAFVPHDLYYVSAVAAGVIVNSSKVKGACLYRIERFTLT